MDLAALAIIISLLVARARGARDGRQGGDFTDLWELAFPDTDILMLFEPAGDGIEDSNIRATTSGQAPSPQDTGSLVSTTSSRSIPRSRRTPDGGARCEPSGLERACYVPSSRTTRSLGREHRMPVPERVSRSWRRSSWRHSVRPTTGICSKGSQDGLVRSLVGWRRHAFAGRCAGRRLTKS